MEHVKDDRILADRIDQYAVGALLLIAIMATVLAFVRLALRVLPGLAKEVLPRSWKEALYLSAVPARTHRT